jgi:hypothetical protein
MVPSTPPGAAALAELHRIVKPGGLIGVPAVDLGGLLVDAASEGPAQALAAYLANQKKDSKGSQRRPQTRPLAAQHRIYGSDDECFVRGKH